MSAHQIYLTVKAAAERIGIHPRTLRDAIYDGILPAYKPPHGDTLVLMEDLLAYVKNHPVNATAA